MTLIFGAAGDDRLDANAAFDFIFGRGGDDSLTGLGNGPTFLFGGRGNDYLIGDYSPGLDATGDDFLFGGRGDDFLSGMAGNDRLSGGAGADHLKGGEGDDILIGGKGRDVFRMSIDGTNGLDTIRDFRSGADKIKLGTGSNKAMTEDQFSALIDYDQNTGVVTYDGTDIAVLKNRPADLSGADFLI